MTETMWFFTATGTWLLRGVLLNPVVWLLVAAALYYAHDDLETHRRMSTVCALATGHVPDSATNDKIDAACHPGTSPSG